MDRLAVTNQTNHHVGPKIKKKEETQFPIHFTAFFCLRRKFEDEVSSVDPISISSHGPRSSALYKLGQQSDLWLRYSMPINMLLPLLLSHLIGASMTDYSLVSLFANTNRIHLFSNALSIAETRKKLHPRQRNLSPTSFLGVSNTERSKTTKLAAATSPPISPVFKWIPTRVEFEGVYRSYGPPTLWRTLTSSVPRREFALQDITLAFGKAPDSNSSSENTGNEDSVCLLLGASSSGKSTIFRSLLEVTETEGDKGFVRSENKGHLSIRQLTLPGQSEANSEETATPILLDDRGEVNTSSGKSKATLGEAWSNRAMEMLKATNKSDEDAKSFTTSLAKFLADAIFELDPDAPLVNLTPSEKYRFCLGKACIESSVGATRNYNSNVLPGPILLLDEWMDVETSAVVRKVQPSLHKIVEELNGVVLSITHKPELYARDASTLRRITLSAGKLLSDY